MIFNQIKKYLLFITARVIQLRAIETYKEGACIATFIGTFSLLMVRNAYL